MNIFKKVLALTMPIVIGIFGWGTVAMASPSVPEPHIRAIHDIEPPPTKEEIIDSYVYEACRSYSNVDPDLVRAMVYQESRYKPNAVNYDGTCVGLMQVSTRWHADRASKLGVTDWFDPQSNILLGVDYISELIDRYGDLKLAVMVYNLGDSEAKSYYSQGKLNNYAKSVFARMEVLKSGGE